MIAAGRSSMGGLFNSRFPRVSLRRESNWKTILEFSGQPGDPAVIFVISCDTIRGE